MGQKEKGAALNELVKMLAEIAVEDYLREEEGQERYNHCDNFSYEESDVAKSTRNSEKPWTPAQVKELKTLAKGNTPTRVIGLKLGRTAPAIYNKASEEGIRLKPANQSPYGTRKR
jgi:hypothetical protein